MIFFDVESCKFDIKKPLDICLRFAKKAEDENLALGRYELGEGIYCTISEVAPKAQQGDFFEAHRKYVDLHYIMRGSQKIKIAFAEKLLFHSYTEERDYVKLSGDSYSTINVCEGTALCLFPNDAHSLYNNETVKKICFKIPAELF